MGWDRPPGRTLFGRESRKRANCCVETRNAWELVNSSRRSLVGTETSAWEVDSSPCKTLFGNSRERVRFCLGKCRVRAKRGRAVNPNALVDSRVLLTSRFILSERAENAEGVNRGARANRQRFFIEIYLVEHRVKRLENRRSHRQTKALGTQLSRTVVPSAAHIDRFFDHTPQQSLR